MNAIPWYRSPVFVGAVVSILSQLVVLFGLSDQISSEDISKTVDGVFQVIALLAALYAAFKRKASPIQPLTATAAGADRKNQGGFVRFEFLAGLSIALLLATVAVLSSCATTPADVLEIACDRSSNYNVERCAKGIGETWEVYQKRAEELIADSATPADVKRKVQQAEAASRPVIVELLRSAAVVARIRADLADGASIDEKLAFETTILEGHIALALPRVRGLRDALGI